jgi:hypothetical protein
MQIRQHDQFETFNKLLGEGHPISLESCEDPRELQRGNVSAKEFNCSLNSNYPALQVIQSLNKLRQQKSALRSYYLKNIDNGDLDQGILGMVRFPEEKDSKEPVLLVLSNLTEQPKTLNINKLHIGYLVKGPEYSIDKLKQIFKLETQSNNTSLVSEECLTIVPEKGEYSFNLQPYSALLLECK